LEVGIAEKILKARKLNGSFWRYLKRCFEVETTKKNESKEAKYCILALFVIQTLDVGTA